MSYLEEEIKKSDKLVENLIDSKFGKKILFTGLSQSGKSSIIQTVFEGRNPDLSSELRATVGFIRKQIDYAGISLYIFDLGGQESYLEEAFGPLRESLFSNLAHLIFVVDSANFGEYQKAREYFLKAIRNLEEFSKKATVSIFAHKIDLIPDYNREERIGTIKTLFDINSLERVKLYSTSIFEESIFEAIEKTLESEI